MLKLFIALSFLISSSVWASNTIERATCYTVYNSIYSIDLTGSYISVEYEGGGLAEWRDVNVTSSTQGNKIYLHFEHQDSGLKGDITFKTDGEAYGEGYINDSRLDEGKEHALCLING